MNVTPVMRPLSGSMASRLTTACTTMSTCPESMLSRIFNALNFACTGQIGTQLEFPWQRCPMAGLCTAPTGR
ncbi:hypothetical protein D3C81_1333850 [compost metagenome]